MLDKISSLPILPDGWEWCVGDDLVIAFDTVPPFTVITAREGNVTVKDLDQSTPADAPFDVMEQVVLVYAAMIASLRHTPRQCPTVSRTGQRMH